MTLSPAHIDRLSRAAKHLAEASKDLPLLRAVDWPDGAAEAFLEGGAQSLPQIVYPKIDTSKAKAHLKDASREWDGDDPVAEWLRRTAGQLETQIALIETRATPEFGRHSIALFGEPSAPLIDRQTRTIDFARHVDATLAALDLPHLVPGDPPEPISAEGFASEIRQRLGRYFDPIDCPEVVVAAGVSSKVAASSTRIRIRAGARFSEMDIRQLLHHEALIHVATGVNGKAQERFPILARSHPGTTMIQEGLAVFAEIITGAMDPARFRRLADRVIAINMTLEGADFIEVYRYYLDRTDDPRESFENARRIFRGGVLTGGAPFTKDMVYLNGLLRVHNFMRTAVKLHRADLIRLVFVGKMDLEDVPAMALLLDAGAISAPRILPPWASDLRFLVSYLSYSSFLNQIQLPGFQDYYSERLADVPSLWGKLV